MLTNEILLDAFSRIQEVVHDACEGLTPDQLAFRPGEDANSIAWLVWHLARIQDDHVASAAGVEQVWTAQGFVHKFDLPFGISATGYGHNTKQVGGVRLNAKQLTGYYDAVHQQTMKFIKSLSESDFGRIVDERWNPPVTLAVRLVSVIADDLQHAGQAAYVRGLLPKDA